MYYSSNGYFIICSASKRTQVNVEMLISFTFAVKSKLFNKFSFTKNAPPIDLEIAFFSVYKKSIKIPEFSVEAAIGNVSSLTYKITFAVDDKDSGL